jgi:hypothetical protein
MPVGSVKAATSAKRNDVLLSDRAIYGSPWGCWFSSPAGRRVEAAEIHFCKKLLDEP